MSLVPDFNADLRNMPSYSIIIPCYCSGLWLEELVQRIDVVMCARGEPFEVVLVNDASPDNTWEVAERLAAQYPFVSAIDLVFNTGQFRATFCGLQHAQGDIIILMDDDLQHPPEELPKLIDALATHPEWDCVMGVYETKQHSLFRNLGSKMWMQLAATIYGLPRNVRRSSFRIMTRDVARSICLHGTVNPVIGPLMFRSARGVGNVQVRHNPRTHGKSGYRWMRLTRIVLDNIFSASTIPLKAVSLFGLVCAGLSALLSCYYLLRYLLNQTSVPGFTSQILLITFFGGSILFSIGLIGEYLIRIIEEVRKPPRYVVREMSGRRTDTKGRADEVDLASDG